MKFVKKNDLKLINGGYLADKDENPVTHDEFVKLQKKSHFLVLFAEKIKDKDFEGKSPDDLILILSEVQKDIAKSDIVEYQKFPKPPKTTIIDSLTLESLKWLDYQKEEKLAADTNKDMQMFNTIKEFEEFGLYFKEGLVKLKKIYTIKEIVEAVNTINNKNLNIKNLL